MAILFKAAIVLLSVVLVGACAAALAEHYPAEMSSFARKTVVVTQEAPTSASEVSIPPIDAATPGKTETATFALG
jgi:hypothetical protein